MQLTERLSTKRRLELHSARETYLCATAPKASDPTSNQGGITRLRTEAIKHARLWVQQLDKTADLVSDIGRIIDRERPTRPDGRLVRIGQPTQIWTACQRLRTALGLLERLKGHDLPIARRLAEGSQHVFLD